MLNFLFLTKPFGVTIHSSPLLEWMVSHRVWCRGKFIVKIKCFDYTCLIADLIMVLTWKQWVELLTKMNLIVALQDRILAYRPLWKDLSRPLWKDLSSPFTSWFCICTAISFGYLFSLQTRYPDLNALPSLVKVDWLIEWLCMNSIVPD